MAKSILVVDYDPKRIETTIRPFTEAGYRVEVARDGVAGVEAFARLHPDLVLVEMMLPKRHGFEVCQEFHKLRPGKKTPVVILGSTQAERYRLQAIGAGASDYLVRPVPDDRLLEICKTLLEEPNQDLPAVESKPVAPPEARLEDSLPDFFKEPVRPAAKVAPKTAPRAASAPAAPPRLDLVDLSDDEISARLDALLPTESGPSARKPEVPKPDSAEAASVKISPKPTPAPVAEPVQALAPAPAPVRAPAPPDPAPPVAAPVERPAPRAKLPQAEALPGIQAVPSGTERRGVPWPLVAGIGLIVVIGGSYAWRAWNSDDGAAVETAALDALDFAPVPANEGASTPPGIPVDVAIPDATADRPVEHAAPVRPSTPGPVPDEPKAAPRAEPQVVAATRAEAREAPAVAEPTPTSAQPSPASPARVEPPQVPSVAPSLAPSVPAEAPVEEALTLAEAIEPVGGIAALSPAIPEAAPRRAGVVPGSIVELSEADTPPIAVSRAAPTYPPLARRMRREGRVAVRLLVDENGNVADAVAADAAAPVEFAAEAVKAARNWHYRPAKKDGVPVKVWITEVIAFKM